MVSCPIYSRPWVSPENDQKLSQPIRYLGPVAIPRAAPKTDPCTPTMVPEPRRLPCSHATAQEPPHRAWPRTLPVEVSKVIRAAQRGGSAVLRVARCPCAADLGPADGFARGVEHGIRHWKHRKCRDGDELCGDAVCISRRLLQTATQASREAGSGSRVRFSNTEAWTQDFQSRAQP